MTVGDGTSFIDLGAGNSGATFAFCGADTASGTLRILNWDGAPSLDGGMDNLIFGDESLADLTADQLTGIELSISMV